MQPVLEAQKAQNGTGQCASLSEYNKLIEGSVPRHAGNTLALLARRCMAPSSPKGRHTPFQRTFLYLYIDPLTRIRGSFKDMAMGACLARGNSRIFVLFSPPRANFRYLKDGGETRDFFFAFQNLRHNIRWFSFV